MPPLVDDQVPAKALVIGWMSGSRHPGPLAATELELVHAENGGLGLRRFYEVHPDVVVLDVTVERPDCWQVLARIRELSDAPVVLLTEGAGERVRGLRAGADDCVDKEVGETEVAARIEAQLRRHHSAQPLRAPLVDDFVTVDRVGHRVEVLGVEVELTPTEFRMLETFASHPGQVLGQSQLLELIWGDRIRGPDEVKLYVSYLRRKLADAARVDPVETVRGVGYRYRPRRMSAESD